MQQIRAEALSKTYIVRKRLPGLGGLVRREAHKVRALTEATFAINEGELVGYIGPNGAGKSTTVKILSGILTPDSGGLTVLGLTPWKARVRHVSNIGVVFGQRTQLWWDLPVLDSFALLRDIYRVEPRTYQRELKTLCDRLDLGPLLRTPVRQLSLGQRMRCEFAGSLIHSPKLLFLDEPTIGLDAVTKLAVRDFIRELNRERGLTVILTTHDMDDIEALCSRVMLIGDGRILMDGPLSALRQGHDERVLTADLECPAADVPLPEGVTALSADRNRLVLRFDAQVVSASALIAKLSRHGLTDVTVEHTPIERVIARLYGEMKGGDPHGAV
jgi:ABC-2 type transport system ATP-binding protein